VRSKNRYRIKGLTGEPARVLDSSTVGVLTRSGNVDDGLRGIVIGLERSDAFLQRRGIINSEIEYQLEAERN